MSKYIKIEVPDDFEVSGHRLLDFQQDCPEGNIPVKEWEPQYTKILDHGFVGLVDCYGDDAAIVNAARVSYGKGTTKTRSDRGLIRYLMRHLHTTPFEMCDFKFHVKAPIFVFRQWHRHRTFSINEYSARYSILDGEMYQPRHEHLAPQSTANRQGRSDGLLTDDEYTVIMEGVEHIYEQSYQTYRWSLGPDENGNRTPPPENIQRRLDWCKEAAVQAVRESRRRAEEGELPNPYPTVESLENAILEYMAHNGVHELGEDFPGVARELARMVLPVATYSQMYWKGNLHNLFHFLNLRCDSHAQYEIRIYADAILDLIRPHVPWAVEAFEDYLLHASRLSRMETEVFQELQLPREHIINRILKEKGCSKREIDDFVAKFNILS